MRQNSVLALNASQRKDKVCGILEVTTGKSGPVIVHYPPQQNNALHGYCLNFGDDCLNFADDCLNFGDKCLHHPRYCLNHPSHCLIIVI